MNFLREFNRSICLFLDRIPFIDSNDHTSACIHCIIDDAFVLCFESAFCIKHDNCHVASFDCASGSHDGIHFNIFFDMTSLSKTGSIYQYNFFAIIFQNTIDGITRCAGNI